MNYQIRTIVKKRTIMEKIESIATSKQRMIKEQSKVSLKLHYKSDQQIPIAKTV